MIGELILNLADEAERQLLARKAKLLSDEGWKFFREVGPNGIYYRGRCPRHGRLQSRPSHDEREALKNAIEHATTYWRR